jgi:glyoxylase-like metal-dependent hydrolase (beta-lactamase superfamily II)
MAETQTSSSAERIFHVSDDIIGLRMPMPPPLEWVNIYFLRDGKGWAMVDTGYNTPDSRAILEDFLATQLEGQPITKMIVTHYHPDHSGQAGWVCARYNCPVYMTQTEWLLARWLSTDRNASYLQMLVSYYRHAGTPDNLLEIIQNRGNSFLRTSDEIPASYQRLTENDMIKIGTQQWRILIGRGHAPEMILMYDADNKFLISADQIVARITPNIGVWAYDTAANPLKDFLDSSAKFPELVPNDVTILPGHGRPFDDFHARVATFAPHHENRLNKLRNGITDQPQNLYQLMKTLFTRELSPRDFVFALGETHAHVNYLLARDEIEKIDSRDFLYKKK